ncbi:MAG: hypothetical protein LBH90_02750 [Tannerella sp.]|jgi:hypothetical protein|nr:hypothetical protein [Tannerella sp.]
MGKNYIPRGIAQFTEYIQISVKKVRNSLVAYAIAPEKLKPVEDALHTFVIAEALAANPDTATTGRRRERDNAMNKLTLLWRNFVNANIRYNDLVPEADRAIFGLKPKDTTPTPVGVPDRVPAISIRHEGAYRFEVHVLDNVTGKIKNPPHASGSYLYVAVTELNHTPQHGDEFRKCSFSSNNKHVLLFRMDQKGMQASIYARYSNVHGKEGPEGLAKVIVIS